MAAAHFMIMIRNTPTAIGPRARPCLARPNARRAEGSNTARHAHASLKPTAPPPGVEGARSHAYRHRTARASSAAAAAPRHTTLTGSRAAGLDTQAAGCASQSRPRRSARAAAARANPGRLCRHIKVECRHGDESTASVKATAWAAALPPRGAPAWLQQSLGAPFRQGNDAVGRGEGVGVTGAIIALTRCGPDGHALRLCAAQLLVLVMSGHRTSGLQGLAAAEDAHDGSRVRICRARVR